MKKIYTLILLFLFAASFANAQWVQTGPMYGGTINSIVANGGNLYAVSRGSGVFVSANNGVSWSLIPSSPQGHSIAIVGTDIFVGTYFDGVVFSPNNGVNWIQLNNGLPSNSEIDLITAIGTTLFASVASGGLYMSTNNGINWTAANNGLPTLPSTVFSMVKWVDKGFG